MKNWKLNIKITVVISLAVAVCMSVMFLISNGNMSSTMTVMAENNLMTSVNVKAQIIDEYLSSAETVLETFSQSTELRDFVKDPSNEELAKKAQAYNEAFYSEIPTWEGIYLDTWDSTVITHSNPAVPGMVMRKDDGLKQLQDSMLAAGDGVANLGIVQSPASGQLVISMYKAIEENGEPIGFVGGATGAAGLKDLLDASVPEGLESATYSLVNLNNDMFIFDSDESLIYTQISESADPAYAKVIEQIKNSGKEQGKINYRDSKGESFILVYKVMSDRGWAVIMKGTESEVYKDVVTGKRALLITCIVIFFIISGVSYLMISIETKPLQKVVGSIERLERLDLNLDHTVEQYYGRTNEVGQIATAVYNLTSKFSSIIETLGNCSGSLNNRANEMSDTFRALCDNIENNAATTEELSASILNTNEAIKRMSDEMANMGEMIERITGEVRSGSDRSEDLIRTANDMADKSEQTLTDSMQRIESTKNNIKEAMEALSSLSRINEMASKILDIASQTNLLSLNASIEAARAGDMGKGFAVVADEIGKLADDSSQTAAHIQHICADSTESIDRVEACFADIVDFMETDVTGYFQEFSGMAKEYGGEVRGIREAIAVIARTTDEFKDSMDTIRDQVEQVSAASNDNERGVEDIITKNDMTTDTADKIMRVAEENTENAKEINGIIDQFNR